MAFTSRQRLGGALATSVFAILVSVFAVEGGYTNDPQDPGGETNHGITKSVAVTHGYTAPMKELPVEVAQDIYITDYMEKPGFLPVVEISKGVGHKLVDAGVNTGPTRPARWFQIALNSLNRNQKDYKDVPVDGKIGPATIKAYSSLVQVRGRIQACTMIIKLLDAQQAMHYISLTDLETYTPGWVINRIGNVPYSDCNK